MLYTCMEHQQSFAGLSDEQLIDAVGGLASGERVATADLVAALAEFDARRLHLPLGYTSLFAYCVQHLRMSEDATFNRIEAARALRRFPTILVKLRNGELTLTAVRLLAPHLTSDNHVDVLSAATHKTKREVEVLVATLRPLPPVPSVVRKLPEPRVQVVALPEQPVRAEIVDAPVLAGPALPALPSRRAVVAPLSEAHYKLQVTISASAHARLRRVQDLMRHVQPNGDPAVIVERALETLERELLRRKAAEVPRPRSSTKEGAQGRHVPSGVKRHVWRRDGGRCAFRREDGRRCDATGLLEFHHVVPYAHGGETNAANLELRCRAHNGFEWDRLADSSKPAVTTTAAEF